jgi:hypothetical protein
VYSQLVPGKVILLVQEFRHFNLKEEREERRKEGRRDGEGRKGGRKEGGGEEGKKK